MNTKTKLLLIFIGLLSAMSCTPCMGQTHKDSVKMDSTEVRTLYRNAIILQQQLHLLHIDGLLRDKMDSVYNQSAAIFENRLKKVEKKVEPKK